MSTRRTSALGLTRRNLGQEIGEDTIVGDRLIHVRMGPVRAPQSSRRKQSNQHPREGHRVRVGRTGARDALASAHFRPEPLVFHEGEEHPESWLIKAKRGVNAPQMIDHDWNGRSFQGRRKVGEIIGGAMDLQVPTEGGQAVGEGDHILDRRAVAEMSHVL